MNGYVIAALNFVLLHFFSNISFQLDIERIFISLEPFLVLLTLTQIDANEKELYRRNQKMSILFNHIKIYKMYIN